MQSSLGHHLARLAFWQTRGLLLSLRGGALKTAVLVKVLFSEPWTYCLSLCFVRAEESGSRLW